MNTTPLNSTTPHSNTARHSRGRRAALVFGGAAAGVLLAIAVPLAASAHVHVDPASGSAGGSETLTFSFSHGCDGSPTTALVIDIPQGVATTAPVVQGGWTIARDLGADEQPTSVTFTSDTPIESGLQASVSLAVSFSEDAANTDLAFPVTQECVDGRAEWTEVAAEGEDPESLDAPAPIVSVGAVVEGDAHEHGASSDEADADHDYAHASQAADDSGATADPAARWLAGGALAVGIAALVVALVRGRRRV